MTDAGNRTPEDGGAPSQRITAAPGAQEEARTDSGLLCLIAVGHYLERSLTAQQLRHDRGQGDRQFNAVDILVACKDNLMQARVRRMSSSELAALRQLPAPPILMMRDGSFQLFVARSADGWLLRRPEEAEPALVSKQELRRMWSGRAILIQPSMDQSGRVFDGRWFRAELARHKALVGMIVLCGLFTTLLGLATPLFIQVIINKIVPEGSTASLTVMAIGLAIAYLATALFAWLQQHLIVHVGTKVDAVLSDRIFAHLLRLGLPYFEARQVGQTVARLRELETVRSFFTGSALTAPLSLLFAVLAFGVMLYYDFILTLIVAAQLPVLFVLAVIATPALRRRIEQYFQDGARVHAFLVESVSSIQIVKGMAVEPQQRNRWQDHVAQACLAHFRLAAYSNSVSQAVRFINQVAMFAVLVYGVMLVFDGKLSIGAFIAVHMIASRVSEPILQLAAIWPEWQQVRISIARLGDIMNARAEAEHHRAQPHAVRGTINFSNVSFRYKGEASLIDEAGARRDLQGNRAVDPPVTPPFVLRNIDLEIAPGEVVGIVGASGSGKSTLVKLVKRLYAPTEGTILIDGTNVAQMPLGWLRRQVGDVAQENQLFNRTIHENIALTDPMLPRSVVQEAARMAGAHSFITMLEAGYDTMIEERGVNLSGGQRQRIAIARTLVTNPSILIFDEATSALDLESEQVIQQNMAAMTEGRTVLIVAHRLAAIRYASRIIVMHHGEIVENDTHDELLKLSGHYAALWALQAGNTATEDHHDG